MAFPSATKAKMLLEFHEYLYQPGWTFSGCKYALTYTCFTLFGYLSPGCAFLTIGIGRKYGRVCLGGQTPDERELLENFDKIIEEFLRLKPKYQTIIADICKRMGSGMAEFVVKVRAERVQMG